MRRFARLEIFLHHLEHNLKLLQRFHPQKKILAMVKANAYGHGALEVTEYLLRRQRVFDFGVATLEEAIFLRRQIQDYNFNLYLFSEIGYREEEVEATLTCCANRKIIPVLSSLEHLEIYLKNPSWRGLPLCLKFNLHMNRLGINETQVCQVIALLKKFQRSHIHHMMGHGNSVEPQKLQNEKFLAMKKNLVEAGVVVANSSFAKSQNIIAQEATLPHEYLRPGLLLYGMASCSEDKKWPLLPVGKLTASLLQTRTVKGGEPIGYEADKAPREGILATLALGYGDGLPFALKGKKIFHEGHEGEFVGKINMDMASILFPLAAGDALKKNPKLLLWGEEMGATYQRALEVQVSPHALNTCLTARVPREYYCHEI